MLCGCNENKILCGLVTSLRGFPDEKSHPIYFDITNTPMNYTAHYIVVEQGSSNTQQIKFQF